MAELFYLFGVYRSAGEKPALRPIIERVSDSDFGEEAFSQNLQDLEWVKDKVLHHQTILAEHLQQHALIPIKFGSVFKTESAIQTLIDEKHDYFQEQLGKLEGREEWGIKLYYEGELLDQSLMATAPSLISLQESMDQSPSKGAQFLHKKKLEKLLSEVRKSHLNQCRKTVFEEAQRISSELKVKEEQATGASHLYNFLNLTCLIGTEEVRHLEQLLNDQQPQFEKQGISFELSGPWPAYSFVA